MIVPIDETNELIKITRATRSVYVTELISHVNFVPLINNSTNLKNYDPNLENNQDNHDHNNSHILFNNNNENLSPILRYPSSQQPKVKLSPGNDIYPYSFSISFNLNISFILVCWAPVHSRHSQFSKIYRDAVFTLILISYCSPSKRIDQNKNMVNIPSFIMMSILSYTSRDWFNPIVSELELLAKDLRIERNMRIEAEELKKQTATLRHAEREILRLKVLLRRNTN